MQLLGLSGPNLAWNVESRPLLSAFYAQLGGPQLTDPGGLSVSPTSGSPADPFACIPHVPAWDPVYYLTLAFGCTHFAGKRLFSEC